MLILKKVRKEKKDLSMVGDIYQAANVIKVWWSFCQWSLFEESVSEADVSNDSRESLRNECQDKRTSDMMRWLLEVFEDHEKMWCKTTWDAVWSRGVGVKLTYTWPEESGNWMAEEMKPQLILRASKERRRMLAQRIEKKLSKDGTVIRCGQLRSFDDDMKTRQQEW